MLEEELRETQKKLQEIQRSQIDPKEYENMVRDNQDLIKTISLKDQDILYTTKVVNQLQDEKTAVERKYKTVIQHIKKLDQSFKDYKQKIENEDRGDQEKLRKDLKQIRENYNNQITQLQKNFEKERKRFRDQLSQRLRPGEIKSIQILLKNLSFDDVNEEDYEKAYKEYKTSRDKFSRKSEDQRLPKVERLMNEELKKLADMRLDMLNMAFNRPAETAAGKDFVKRTDQTLSGKWYRFRKWIRRNFGNISGFIMGVGSVIYTIFDKITSAGRETIRYIYKGVSWLYSKSPSGETISNTAKTLSNIVRTGVEMTGDALKFTADTAKFAIDNTITVFVAIIALIGIIFTMKTSRGK